MYIPKRYGQSKAQNCPFCGKQAITRSKEGVPVCLAHKESKMEDKKCACGRWLELRVGKWGPYFHCINCGNINFNKGRGMDDL